MNEITVAPKEMVARVTETSLRALTRLVREAVEAYVAVRAHPDDDAAHKTLRDVMRRLDHFTDPE